MLSDLRNPRIVSGIRDQVRGALRQEPEQTGKAKRRARQTQPLPSGEQTKREADDQSDQPRPRHKKIRHAPCRDALTRDDTVCSECEERQRHRGDTEQREKNAGRRDLQPRPARCGEGRD